MARQQRSDSLQTIALSNAQAKSRSREWDSGKASSTASGRAALMVGKACLSHVRRPSGRTLRVPLRARLSGAASDRWRRLPPSRQGSRLGRPAPPPRRSICRTRPRIGHPARGMAGRGRAQGVWQRIGAFLLGAPPRAPLPPCASLRRTAQARFGWLVLAASPAEDLSSSAQKPSGDYGADDYPWITGWLRTAT